MFYLISLRKILLLYRSYRIVNPWLWKSEKELVLYAGVVLYASLCGSVNQLDYLCR